MADIQKTTYELEMGFEQLDGKTKYISIPNPKSGITGNEIREAMQYIVDNGILLDSDGQSFTGVVTAYTENKIKTSLDLD